MGGVLDTLFVPVKHEVALLRRFGAGTELTIRTAALEVFVSHFLQHQPKLENTMSMNISFDNKVALVTGASSGMGLATAKAFAEAGATVVLADVREEAVRAEADKLVAADHKAIAIRCDVSADAQVAAMIDQIVATLGRIDAAFNNAGVMAKVANTADSTLEEFERVTSINLNGVWSCMKHELRHMLQQEGGGAIVNCASTGAIMATPGIPAYIASKHGVVGLTRTAALEYAAKGIRVNAVCPGAIDTQIARDVVAGDDKAFEALSKSAAIGRIGQPEEIAGAVLWLCSSYASDVVGHPLVVDGGLTVA